MKITSWFPYNGFATTAKIRLFCFSHAGGAASNFRNWQSFFSSNIEVCPIQLPGRENRFGEPFITDMDDLIGKIWPHISSVLNHSSAFFGHSLGGIVAYELAKRMHKENKTPLLKLFISSSSAPKPVNSTFHQLSDERFIQHLKKYGGMPTQLVEDIDALNIFLPRLRADFTLFETYHDRVPSVLNVPIVVSGGKEDELINAENLRAWGKYTKASFAMQFFQGGHFYLQQFAQELCQIIQQQLLLEYQL